MQARYAIDIDDFFTWIEKSASLLKQALRHDVFMAFNS